MFHGDCWLSLVLDQCEPDTSSSLVLLNTEQATTGDPGPTRTVFHFDPHEHQFLGVISDRGGYDPSPEEVLLAPFYQDTSQRIFAMMVLKGFDSSIFVMKTEVLLKLAREWGGTDLEWEQWGTHAVQVLSVELSDPWVSGSRLLCTRSFGRIDVRARVSVYDFSPRASARYVEIATEDDGKAVRRMRPSVEGRRLPWHPVEVYFSGGGHDSIALFTPVRSPLPKYGQKLKLYNRAAIVMKIRSRVHYTCGAFDGRCVIGARFCVECSISSPNVGHRASSPVLCLE